MTADFKLIKYNVVSRTAVISLNRPEKRNALNAELVRELSQAFKLAEDDNHVRVILLKAEGKAFCAGADLEYLQQLTKNSFEENLEDSNNLKDLFYQIYTSKKITVAQIQGHAIAGGGGLVTVVDFAFAVPEANFGFTEVKLGFIPALVSVFLVKKIGEAKARELLLTGNLIAAEAAKSIGLIFSVFPAGQIEGEVLKFIQEMTSNTSAHSVSLTKELLLINQNSETSAALEVASHLNAKVRQSDDFKKGVAAFLNKGIPKWD